MSHCQWLSVNRFTSEIETRWQRSRASPLVSGNQTESAVGVVGLVEADRTAYSPTVTICTASLTFTNSTFSPHSLFLCFMCISEQTAIISLYNINWLVYILTYDAHKINWLVCITETECVYCADWVFIYNSVFFSPCVDKRSYIFWSCDG
jgi:hypothetical protein